MNSVQKAQNLIRLQFISDMRKLGVVHGIVETDPDSSRGKKDHFHGVINRRREEIKAEAYIRIQNLS